MSGERTLVTELATAFGMLGYTDPERAISDRRAELAGLGTAGWERLALLNSDGLFETEFQAGLANGRAFLESRDGLSSQKPWLIEWTGGRRAIGDETIPTDLRANHVYFISCKYVSQILHNLSPARLIDGLLATGPLIDESDWYLRMDPDNYEALYTASTDHCGLDDFPERGSEMTRRQRRDLAQALAGTWPPELREKYLALCNVVSAKTASIWASNIDRLGAERMLWRLLRIGPAPYFILGSDTAGSVRLRIDTPWDWRQRFEFRQLTVAPQTGGQPRIGWVGTYEDRATGTRGVVEGHVELRWSHGRFGQRPEAKVYLDTPHQEVPGYNALQ